MLRRPSLIVIAVVAWAGGLTAACEPRSGDEPTAAPARMPPIPVELALETVARGFERPLFVTGAGDGSGRLFVVEKGGKVHVVEGGRVQAEPFLDLSGVVQARANEQGLLGLAFHPRFADNGRLFVTYTSRAGQVVLAEIVAPGPARAAADPATLAPLLTIDHPRSNHNGGMVAFGPDGFLYFGTGDGGGAGDPDRAGQDLSRLAGKILRLDVDRGRPYAIPPGNPFAGTGAPAGARPEIWAYGLRNPWRFSFDRETGDLWIGDVGQNAEEEIDLQPAASRGGENYGWSIMEGSRCFRPSNGCDRAGLTPPVYVYGRDLGCSVTGGYVYRGRLLPGLTGVYLFADYCDGTLYALRSADGVSYAVEQLLDARGEISSFGEDDEGEVYVVFDGGGTVARLAAR